MEEILLSKQQYQAVIKRLDEITGNIITLKQRSHIEDGYIDNVDMLRLFQISGRTAQPWSASSSLRGEGFCLQVKSPCPFNALWQAYRCIGVQWFSTTCVNIFNEVGIYIITLIL